MNSRQLRTLRSFFVGVLALVALLFSFPYIKKYLDDKIEDTKEKPLLTVYVNGREAANDDLLVYPNVGHEHVIVVKYTESKKMYDEALEYSVGVKDILTIKDNNEDELMVSVTLTSVGVTPNLFNLQINNKDQSFTFNFKVKTTIVPASSIDLGDDLIFTE